MICLDGDAYILDLCIRSEESDQYNLWCKSASKNAVKDLAY